MKRLKEFFERHAVWFVVLASLVASVVATYYYFTHGDTLAYNDARSHLDIARRVVDSKTPGVTQFGGAWLPLPQLLMLPFIASNTLWHDGLAGSFVSMAAYVFSAVFIFKLLKITTRSVYLGVCGAMIFMFNPNILYMQSTPMSELVLLATMLFGSYFFIKWLYTKSTPDLIISAFGMFLATLVRYEGWFALATCAAIILFDSVVFTKNKKMAEGQTILFTTLGFLGIAVWLLWNLAIWGNPFYFFDGGTSALSQQNALAAAGKLPTRYNPALSFLTTVTTVHLIIGTLTGILAIASICVVVARNFKDKRIIYALLILLAPITFDYITLIMGVTTIVTSFSHMFNVRYGLMATPFIAVIIPLALYSIPGTKLLNVLKAMVGVFAIVASASALLVTLHYDAVSDNSSDVPYVVEFRQAVHRDYKGGNIMASAYTLDPVMQELGIPFKNYIYEGNYHYWTKSLARPQSMVSYILMTHSQGNPDLIYADYLKHPKLFNKYYYVAFDKGGYELLISKKLQKEESHA